MVYSNDRKAFFSHIRSRCGGNQDSVHLCINGTALNNQETVYTLRHVFEKNFSNNPKCEPQPRDDACTSSPATSSLQFNCTERM